MNCSLTKLFFSAFTHRLMIKPMTLSNFAVITRSSDFRLTFNIFEYSHVFICLILSINGGWYCYAYHILKLTWIVYWFEMLKCWNILTCLIKESVISSFFSSISLNYYECLSFFTLTHSINIYSNVKQDYAISYSLSYMGQVWHAL
jgi:hypothetical protein